MASELRDPWDDQGEHLKGLPDHILLDIARNDSAELRYRLFATELLQRMRSHRANHPDIQWLVRQIDVEMDGIPTEYEYPEIAPGPLTCSVTTKTMFGEPELIKDEDGNTGPSDNLLPSEARDNDPERERDVPGKPQPTPRPKRNPRRQQNSVVV